MCTIPPPPPPPPISTDKLNITFSNPIDLPSSDILCQWAVDYRELLLACIRNKICLHNPPYKYKYKQVESIIQVGPTCGLNALSMLINGKVKPEEIFERAKLEGYSQNGEMFSCKYMGGLAEKVFNSTNINNIRFTIKNGGLCSRETIDCLLNGAVLLVPYDADCNHSPCLRNGHTAHWAFVCGILIVEELGDDNIDHNNIYVLCKHGKSMNLAVWKLADLESSNKNLTEFSPKKQSDGLLYIMPEDGIGGSNGLRDQYLMFEEA